MDRIATDLSEKITTANQASQLISTGMTIGMSGFAIVGYPKAVPMALAKSRHATNLTLCTGASIGDEADGVLARSGLISRRYTYQSNKDMRAAINNGSVAYNDMHISQFPTFINNGIGMPIDVAIIECTAVTENGLVPTGSVGAADALVRAAKYVIAEIDMTVPIEMIGMHDIFEISRMPCPRDIPITSATSRIGVPYIACPKEKIAAIVLSDIADQPAKNKPMTPATAKLGENVVQFIKDEIACGHLPEHLPPIQSGVGNIGNAVLRGLGAGGFKDLTMYSEVMQDAVVALMRDGVIDSVSASAISLEKETREYFYKHINEFKDRIVIRPQEISNNSTVIRRLGVIAINTPIELDIYGNINSSHIMGSRMMNGIGGSGDFTRNAWLSIFATESTAKGGLISCIVPMVSHVDHTEHDVQVIVTEQGIADLRWKSPCERAELLIENCAHPDYRPMLREYFEHAKQVANGQHTPHDLKTALSWHCRYLETGSMRE